MDPEQYFEEIAKNKALHDIEHDQVFNGYEPGTNLYLIYQAVIDEHEAKKKQLH